MTLYECSELLVCSYIWRVLIFFLSVLLLLEEGEVLSVCFILLVLLFSIGVVFFFS